MIKDLSIKANSEKYFKSIRYFYHNLAKNQKHVFVLQVAKYNIYLSAQCVMSSQKDELIENELIKLAESYARDFYNSENSALGFLALAEFEQFLIISDLLKVVQNPTKTHFLVFKKIFESNNSQEIFIQLLEVLLSISKIPLVSYCVTAYNGKIQITVENRSLFNSLFDFLFENGNYGIAKSILEKFDLFSELKIIFNTEPIEIVERLINSKKKRIPAIRLAYEIYNRYNLIKQLKSEIFLERLLELGSEKSLVIAINIAKRQNIDDKRLNEQISNLLNPNRKQPKVINRVKRKISQLINVGFLEYISKNESLKEQLSRFEESIDYQFEKKRNILEVKAPLFSKNEYSIYGDYIEIPINKPVIEIIEEYFKMSKRPSLEVLVNMLVFHFKSSYLEISHLLRKYEFSGRVKAIFDYGFYIESTEIEARNLLFLHRGQAFEENEKSNLLTEETEIKFRIIGINQKNLRFNISRLEKFAEICDKPF